MKKYILIRTNLLVCLVVLFGYLTCSVLSFRSNYESELINIEQLTLLSSQGAYSQTLSELSEPLNIVGAMAGDTFLKTFLEKESSLSTLAFAQSVKSYLHEYHLQYGYDSVFLISTATNLYYTHEGLYNSIDSDDRANDWYEDFLAQEVDFRVITGDNLESDKVDTLFVTCKLRDENGSLIGIVGVGKRMKALYNILENFEQTFGVSAYFMKNDGQILLATTRNVQETLDYFAGSERQPLREELIKWKGQEEFQSFWIQGKGDLKENDYVVVRYMPELECYLLVERDTGTLISRLQYQQYWTVAIIAGIMMLTFFVITYVIRGFNHQIFSLTLQKEESFRKATEQLYDNIYEINITKNRAEGAGTQHYFESLGISKNMSYDRALLLLVEKQVKEEFREGYISTFCPENVIKQSDQGNFHLQYEFMSRKNGGEYCWMRIEAYLYRREDDGTLHMFTYHKNVDVDIRRKQELSELTKTDLMTQFYNKEWTRTLIDDMIKKYPGRSHAFFIFDIDNFKQANDLYGHAFGDFAIMEFTDILRQHFRPEDIIGRIGGDEFVVFIPIPDERWATLKSREISCALDIMCSDQTYSWKMSASIGVAIFPEHGADFERLYRNADTALYKTKHRGKNGYTVYNSTED